MFQGSRNLLISPFNACQYRACTCQQLSVLANPLGCWLGPEGGAMPKILRMPTHAELPEGPWREFVEALFRYYHSADRPDLRTIETAVENLDEDQRIGTASRETIRQMLRGRTVPRQWGTAATVLSALCALAGTDPNDYEDGAFGYGSSRSHLSAFKELWNNAADVSRPLSHAEIQAIEVENNQAMARMMRDQRRRRRAASNSGPPTP
jgi:hypothetical protein